VLPAEDVLELSGGPQRLVVLAEPQPGLDLTGGAAGGGDEPPGVGADELAVHPRPLAHLSLEGRPRPEAEEVVHPLVVAREQGHVGVGTAGGDVVLGLVLLTPAHPGLVEARGAGGDVGLQPDDRLDPVLLGGRPGRAGWESSASTLEAPSSLECSACTWRWAKLSDPPAAMPVSLGRPAHFPDDPRRPPRGTACRCAVTAARPRAEGQERVRVRAMSWCQMPASRYRSPVTAA